MGIMEKKMETTILGLGLGVFPKVRGAFLGVLMPRTSILGSILGSPYFGKLPCLGIASLPMWMKCLVPQRYLLSFWVSNGD